MSISCFLLFYFLIWKAIITVSVCLGWAGTTLFIFLGSGHPVPPHYYYLGCGDILVGGGGQGPPGGGPAHQVTLGVVLARVDSLDLGL